MIKLTSTMSDSPTAQTPAGSVSTSKAEEPAKTKIDVKLLDKQLADMDSDEFDSDDDHSGGCSCCAGQVGQIRGH